jgi:hypothetical protein
MKLQEQISRIKEVMQINEIKVPKLLFHGTFKPLLKKIKRDGLGGLSSKPMWEDSQRGVVYLAIDPDVAYSYVETAFEDNEDLPESWGDKMIVLVIDTTTLDHDKFYIDRNVLDNDGSTLEYHGVIPFENIIEVINY